jgi:hypothetical protein
LKPNVYRGGGELRRDYQVRACEQAGRCQRLDNPASDSLPYEGNVGLMGMVKTWLKHGGFMVDQEYPTIEQLDKLKVLANDHTNVDEMLDFIKSIWWMADWGFHTYDTISDITGRSVSKMELHTGGWSGNEDIIETLKQTWFWRFNWEGSRRGGHYYFEIPNREEKK